MLNNTNTIVLLCSTFLMLNNTNTIVLLCSTFLFSLDMWFLWLCKTQDWFLWCKTGALLTRWIMAWSLIIKTFRNDTTHFNKEKNYENKFSTCDRRVSSFYGKFFFKVKLWIKIWNKGISVMFITCFWYN